MGKAQNGTKSWRPSAKQVALAHLILNPEDRRTKDAKMKEVGVPHRTFYRWMADERYLNYINEQISKYTRAETPGAWRALITQCNRGNIGALRLYFELMQIHPSVKKDNW